MKSSKYILVRNFNTQKYVNNAKRKKMHNMYTFKH